MIKQGKCKYAWVTTPNTKFQPTYTINLEVSEEEYNDYKSKGFPTKQDEDGFYMVIRRKVDGPSGMKRAAPRLFDESKNEVDVQIGNGSEVAVKYTAREWEYNGKAGITADLKAVQVIKHIPYGDNEDFDTVEGNDLDDIPFDDVPMTAAG